jgi:hypothetical protein
MQLPKPESTISLNIDLFPISGYSESTPHSKEFLDQERIRILVDILTERGQAAEESALKSRSLEWRQPSIFC